MKRIISILLILALFSNVAAEHTVTISQKGFTISILNLEVYASDIDAADPWNTYANPGESITVQYAICNWGPVTEQYYGDFMIIDSDGIGTPLWTSPTTTVLPEDCVDYEFTVTAPATPGTYTLKAITSFYPSGVADDTDEWTLHVEGTAPTPTPTATSTPIANIPPTVSVSQTKDGDIFTYDATGSTDPDGSIVSYAWSVDGQQAGTNNIFVLDTSTFTAGLHNVKLVITDNLGAQSSYTQTITVTTDTEGTTTIQESEAHTSEGSVLETEQGTADFIINIAGEPYYIPGFESAISIMGLIAVAWLVRRE